MDPDRLLDLLASDGRPPEERERLVRLMLLFAELPPPPDPHGLYPEYRRLQAAFLETAAGDDGEELEEAFLELYCHVHLSEAPYTPEERQRMDETKGYWCHAGGLSPILKAAPFVHADTVLGDFGAGNGLQALLMQRLYPHRRTVQIEISSRAVEAGRALEGWLGIPPGRVEWVVGDVLDASPRGMDFIYVYRPVRPTGAGRRFYERFTEDLVSEGRPVVIFSIADSLREFLPPEFEVFYTDGHLTCFSREVP
ncbi:MAG: class I SAM-dependent methyltransferase [Planctomycetota bacterium]